MAAVFGLFGTSGKGLLHFTSFLAIWICFPQQIFIAVCASKIAANKRSRTDMEGHVFILFLMDKLFCSSEFPVSLLVYADVLGAINSTAETHQG